MRKLNDKQKLQEIVRFLGEVMDAIEEAAENDSEVTIGGNGINSSEAGATLRPIVKRVNEIVGISKSKTI
jgi:hypothetical protein